MFWDAMETSTREIFRIAFAHSFTLDCFLRERQTI